MGERVLLALGEGGDEVARALLDAGLEVERCGAGRVARALAEGGVALVVVEGGAVPAWARLPGAPAWIAVAEGGAQGLEALEAGAEAALGTDEAPERVALHALRALERGRAEREARRAAERRVADDAWVLEGDSAAAKRLGESLARVASTPRTTVLVRGPVGAPLDALARLVHARSARAAGPLVEVEAAGTPAARWAEVLGEGDAPGGADGGSVVVREVARLDEAGQAALIERLEPRGEGGPRLIATTSRDLAAEVEAGRLREDLAYRLNVLTLVVPGLEERRQDVPVLATRLALRAARALGRTPRRLDPGTREALTRRHWPGDVLELDLYMTSRELLGAVPAEGPGAAPRPAPPGALPALGTPESLVVADRSLKAVEEALIRRVLEETGGNKLRAAEILGIHRTTLYAKLAAYGLGAAEQV